VILTSPAKIVLVNPDFLVSHKTLSDIIRFIFFFLLVWVY
jgi:hypothetical protein